MEIYEFLVLMMLVSFMGLLIIGVPVAYCLFGTAVLFTGISVLADLYLDAGIGMDFNFFGIIVKRLFSIMSNWIMVALPMFIFMGVVLDRSGAAEKLMNSALDMFGRIRGGLAITVTFIGVLLAASTGIVGASVVLLGTMSIPTMLKAGYSKELSTGTVCAAGTLGILIPPSIMLVIMADQLAISVGDLFLGAVFPGLILSALYLIFILVFSFLKPSSAPALQDRETLSWRMVWVLLRDIIPPAFLIVAVLGSIFMGVATVTEASGIGAFAAVVLAGINRKLNRQMLIETFQSTFHIIGYIMTILVGATTFALVLRGLGGDEVIEGLIRALPFGPGGIVISMLFAVFILGFFLDWIEITLIILPLVAPIIGSLELNIQGYGVIDKPEVVWFTMLVAVTLQTSYLTPPMGPGIFFLQGICPPDVKLSHIYRGIIPFVVLQLVVIALLYCFPKLITWLPAAVYG